MFVDGSDGLGDEFFNCKLKVRLGVRVGWFTRRWRGQRELEILHYKFFCGGHGAGSRLVHGGKSRLRRTQLLNCVVVVVCLFVFFCSLLNCHGLFYFILFFLMGYHGLSTVCHWA